MARVPRIQAADRQFRKRSLRREVRMTEDISKLPLEEQIKRYRQMAADAASVAAKSTGTTREAYKLMAEQWRKLAEDIEARLRRQKRD
jgi:hypothetical protein